MARERHEHADSDEVGQWFRFDPGHSFRSDAGQDRSAATLAFLSCLKWPGSVNWNSVAAAFFPPSL